MDNMDMDEVIPNAEAKVDGNIGGQPQNALPAANGPRLKPRLISFPKPYHSGDGRAVSTVRPNQGQNGSGCLQTHIAKQYATSFSAWAPYLVASLSARVPALCTIRPTSSCDPASSAPSERVFSHLNIVVDKRASRTAVELAEQKTYVVYV